MKRILLATNSMVGGGAERVVLTLARALQKEGVHVHLLLMEGIFEAELDFELPVSVFGFKKRSLSNGRRLRALVAAIEQQQGGSFDMIVSNLPETDRMIKQLNHPRSCYCIHTTLSKAYIEQKGLLQRLRRLLRFRRLYRGEQLITVSQGVREDLLSRMKIRPKTVRAIYNPIDVEAILAKARLGEGLGGPQGNYLIHVGNYGSVKRHDILLRAFAEAGIEAQLVLVGKGVEAKMAPLVKELGLEGKVIFAGFVANPYPLIDGARMLVMSSEFEGFSMVIPEALALGVPVVSTDCDSGPREILTGELAGNLVPVNDVARLAAKIREVYGREAHLPKRDYTPYLEPFAPAKIAAEYLALLQLLEKG